MDGARGDIVASAVAEARSEGTIPDVGGDEPIVSTDEGVGDEGDTGDTGDEPGGETTPPAEGSPEAAAAAAAAAEIDSFAQRHGWKKNGKGQYNRVPHHRIPKIAENEVRHYAQQIGKALGLGNDVDYADLKKFMGAIEGMGKELPTMRQRLKGLDDLLPHMGKPENLIQILALDEELGEAWKPFLKHIAGGEGDGGTKTKPAEGDVKDDPEPQPDQLSDPSNPASPKRYSVEQWAKLRAWDRRQAQKETKTEFQQMIKALEDRLAPFEKQAKTVQTQQERMAAREAELNEALDEAGTWEGFAEHEEEIRKTMLEDPKIKTIPKLLSRINAAYRKVVLGKLTSDRAKVRAEVEAEYKAGTKADAAPAGGKKSKEKDDEGPRERGSIVASAVAEARAKGLIK